MAEKLIHPDYDSQGEASALVWNAFQSADIWITMGRGGPRFQFAAGTLSEVKGDFDRLDGAPKERRLVLGVMAVHPCVAWADALAPAPNGMIEVVDEIADQLDRQQNVIRMVRPPDAASRHDIRYASQASRDLAASVRSVCVLEDFSSTGSTVHAQAEILRRTNPGLIVHSVSMLQRAPIRPAYQRGPDAVSYHSLCTPPQPIPLSYDGFVAAFGFQPTLVSADYPSA